MNGNGPKFLPLANEVWGKVIFLHLSVILFTGGESTWAGTPRADTTPRQVQPPGRYTPLVRVPTRTGKPGKMRRHFPVREKSGNFEQTGKVGETTQNTGKLR